MFLGVFVLYKIRIYIYIRSCVDRVDISFFSLREGWMSSFDFLLDPILVYLIVSKDKKQAAAK